MKDRNPPSPNDSVAIVVLLPIDDHRVYTEARRILRCLMGRKTPSLETLLLHELRGRDSAGIVDHYLDAIQWPLELGRAVTIRLRERAARDTAQSRKARRPTVKLPRLPSEPGRN